MSPEPPSSNDNAHHPAPSKRVASMRLERWRLLVARVLYLALLTNLLVVFVTGIPARYDELTAGTTGIDTTFNTEGAIVLLPVRGQPAARAGVRQGDILVAINGAPISPWSEQTKIARALSGRGGTNVILDISSPGESERRIVVTLEPRDPSPLGLSLNAYAVYFLLLDILLTLGFFLPSIIIFWRRSDNLFLIFISAWLLFFAAINAGIFQAFAVSYREWGRAGLFAYTLCNLLVIYLFPTGKFVPKWTRWLVPILIIYALLRALPPAYNPARLLSAATLLILDMTMYIGAFLAHVYRYRRHSDDRARQQTKWVLFGLGITILVMYSTSLAPRLFPVLQESSTTRLFFDLLQRLVRNLAFVGMPITLTIAILRYRLFDIDFVLNRTLVYAPLTAILSGLSVALVTLSQKVFIALTGEKSDAAIVLTTLIVAAGFTPIKTRLQSLVDRYFREPPDPAVRLAALGNQSQSRLSVIDPARAMQRLLEEAVGAFGAKGGAFSANGHGESEIRFIVGDWDGEVRFCVPIQSSEESPCLGTLYLGSRRQGSPYSARDSEALRKVAQIVACAIEQDQPRERTE